MITVRCIEKVRDKNNVITGYILEDCNGMRQTLSSDQVKNMLKCEQLSILNLKLTSNGKLIDKQDYNNKSWDKNYETLCKAINNGVKITSTTVYEGLNIGMWVDHQRQLFKKGKLPEDRIKKLKDIGFEFEVYRTWDENYETLCRAINNGVKITVKTVYEGINIGTWLNHQRQLLKNGKLPEDKVQKLRDTDLKLEAKTVSRRSWDENYETLCRAINNGVNIIQTTVYEGINIGDWISNQRKLFREGKLPEDRVQKLKEVGLELSVIRKLWDENYETLCRAINNDVKITSTTVYEGVNIGRWVSSQRHLFKNGELSEDRIQKLKETGLVLDQREASWDKYYETLCRALNDEVKVTEKTIYEGIHIGKWVSYQRQLFENWELPEDKIQKLKELGLELDPRKVSWDANYEALCKAINNEVKIINTTVYEGVKIGLWLDNQYTLFKNGELPEDKVQKLKELDSRFSTTKKSWDETYVILHKAIINGVKITKTTVYEGVKIGIWLNNQRQLFKKGNLPEDRIKKLRYTGLKLEAKTISRMSWDENYKALCRAINNEIKITDATVYEGANIGSWLNTQRKLFKRGELPEDKIQKLRDTGLELDPRKESWDENYETLCRAINNGVKIESNTVYEGANIGFWVGRQRQHFKNGELSEDKTQKLKDIGLELDPIKSSWDIHYKALCRAIDNKVKINQRTVYEGINIGKWINNQRQNFKNGELSEDRIEKLMEIGVLKT